MVGNVINSMTRAKCDCENCVQGRKDLKILRDEYFKKPVKENWYNMEDKDDKS